MVKAPQGPTENQANGDDNQADMRLNLWEAAYFTEDDDDTPAATSQAAPRPPAPETVAATAYNPSLPDQDLALVRRLANAAASEAQGHADELGNAIYSKFMHLLNEKVRATDGHLTVDDVEEMGAEFQAQLDDIKTVFLDAVESYTIAREKSRVDQARGNLFQRLLVRNFDSAFADEKSLADQPNLLSRRMLPGFFTMLSLMFGASKLAEYEKRTQTVIERLRQANGGQLEWDEVYRSPDARKISLRAEVEIAQYFRDYDKRIDWMQAMVNSHLIPYRENRSGTAWTFTREAADTLLSGLFHDLQSALSNPKARESFTKRLGSDLVEELDKVVMRFK